MSKDQNPSDKACDAYFDNPYAATSGSYYSDRVTFYAGFQAGAASRDAEVAKLKDDNEYLYVAAIERDQLREQVVMLRDVLEITHELYVQASSGYGFARPENPHNYRPDIDCCSKEEIAAHSKACDDYANGRNISGDSWGIGTYNDEYKPAIEALAATEPKHDL